MIKSESLMKGNYVKDDVGRVGFVKAIHERKLIVKLEFSTLSASIDDFEAIPIDEEWLWRLGFKYSEDDEAYQNIDFHIEDRNFDKYISNEERSRLKDCFGIWRNHVSGLIRDIRYVHELQNLNYIITGSQLKLKK